MHDPRGALFPIFQISFDPASSILSTKFTLHLFRTIIQDGYANAYPFERRDLTRRNISNFIFNRQARVY